MGSDELLKAEAWTRTWSFSTGVQSLAKARVRGRWRDGPYPGPVRMGRQEMEGSLTEGGKPDPLAPRGSQVPRSAPLSLSKLQIATSSSSSFPVF